MRIMSPSRNELQHLRTPLTKGEWIVLDFFDKYLSSGWEVYVQPYLNGLRPDFVLLNPAVGIAVYEVKNWSLSALGYHTKTREAKAPELVATDMNERTFSLQSENPVERVYRYKQEIYELYCPRLRQKAGKGLGTSFNYSVEKSNASICMTNCPTIACTLSPKK